MSSLVIIGAGISGLASAALLARDGHTVTVLEARKELGGRAGSWARRGFRFDTGPSWLLMPEAFDHFYRLMGTTLEEQLALVTLDPGYRVYFEGQKEPLEISASREENIELFERIEKGAGSRLDRYLDSASETYELARQRFLYTGFDDLRPVMDRDVRAHLPRLGRLLVEPLSRIVARTVRDRRLRQILGYPAALLGSSPRLTPSVYHLMSHLDMSGGVYYPMGGFARVIETIAELAKEAGARVVTGASVTRIVVEHGAATGVEYTDRKGGVQFLDADFVVSAADLHHTETQLLEPEQRTYPEEYWQSRVAGPGALLLYLGVRGELPELEHHTLLFAKSRQSGSGADPSAAAPASLYICKPSGVDPDVAPEGSECLFVLVPVPADPAIGHGGVDRGGDERVEALADQAIAQIAEWTGIDDLASRITVRRTVGPGDFADDLHAWKGSALGLAHTLRQSGFGRPGTVSRKVARLYYVGASTIPGIGLPMGLISAEILLKRLRGDTSTTPLSEPLLETVSEADAAALEQRQALAAASEAAAAARAARAARIAVFSAATKQAAGRVGRAAAWAAKAVAAGATAAVVTIKAGIEAQRSAPEADTADEEAVEPEAAAFAGEELVVAHSESTDLVVAAPPKRTPKQPRKAELAVVAEVVETADESAEQLAAEADEERREESEEGAEPGPDAEPEEGAQEPDAEPDDETRPEDAEPEASDDSDDEDDEDEDEDEDDGDAEDEDEADEDEDATDGDEAAAEDQDEAGEADDDASPAKRPYWLEEDYDPDAVATEKEGRPYWLDEPDEPLANDSVGIGR